MTAKIIATFQGEAWINDYALPVDNAFTEWDTTAYAAGFSRYLGQLAIRQRSGLNAEDGLLDNDDIFKSDPDAPELVRNWRGPFTIRLREE
jgi:hypothetical protein